MYLLRSCFQIARASMPKFVFFMYGICVLSLRTTF